MMEQLKCARCNKEITNKDEIEYSKWINEYYCGFKCATDAYFEYMESVPLDFDNLDEHKIIIKNGKIYKSIL